MTSPLSREVVETRLASVGLTLGASVPPRGLYHPVRVHDGVAWVSGHTGRDAGRPRHRGVIGESVTVDEALDEARHAAVNLLAALEGAELLPRVAAVLHLRGYLRAHSEFTEHPSVVNAASEVIVLALGATVGVHARTAVGVHSLPGGAPVELEAVVALTS